MVLLAHYVDGLFDTFWIGALSITPFVIAGISLGMADAHARGGPDAADATSPSDRTERPSGVRTPVVGAGRVGPIPPGAEPVATAHDPPPQRSDPTRLRAVTGPPPAPAARGGAVPRLVVNALPLEAVGGGVSTYIRELLGAMAPLVRAELVAAVRPSGVQELPPG